MNRLYCRTFQTVMKLASHFLPWRRPELLEGAGSLSRLPALIKGKGITNVLIVTDKVIASIGLMNDLLEGLNNEGVVFSVYDKTVPNPTIDNIEEAYEMYKDKGCQGIIAFGGGSPMDCAKGVGIRAARPNKRISQLRGILKVRKKLPLLFAIPTTSGTGSEATLAAVIVDSKTHEKYAINDFPLIPPYAVLDPLLTINLPPHVTSTTGMDALTHAVEAYIGKGNTRETREFSRQAVQLIFKNIYKAYADGKDIEARKNMQMASHYAGIAFTRAYVGYVHAVAHTLGGFYSVPHGLANAVILPYVLEYFGESVYKPLSELADLVGICEAGDDLQKKAQSFIKAIRQLNESMNIPKKISGINEGDIPVMIERALKEANPLYPVPRILGKKDMLNIIQMIRE